MLRMQRLGNSERRHGKLECALFHVMLRQLRRRHVTRCQHQSRGARSLLHAQSIMHGIGLNKVHEFKIAVNINALTRKRCRNGRAQNKHIAMKTHLNISHKRSFRSPFDNAYHNGRNRPSALAARKRGRTALLSARLRRSCRLRAILYRTSELEHPSIDTLL